MYTVEKIDNDSASARFLKDVFFTSASRYGRAQLILLGDVKLLTLETYERMFNPIRNGTVAQKDAVRYYVVTPSTQFKPSKISHLAYDDPGYWWAIMEYNNIFDVEEIVVGITLKIPPLSVLPAGG